jgi:hypothetical protein
VKSKAYETKENLKMLLSSTALTSSITQDSVFSGQILELGTICDMCDALRIPGTLMIRDAFVDTFHKIEVTK